MLDELLEEIVNKLKGQGVAAQESTNDIHETLQHLENNLGTDAMKAARNIIGTSPISVNVEDNFSPLNARVIIANERSR